MRFETGARTDVGRVRTLNEDAVGTGPGLALVADGMGGHRGGEVASRLALEAMAGLASETTVDELVEAVGGANRAILQQSMEDLSLAGMGTTLCAVAVLAGEEPAVGVANVGDSRVYLLDAGGLRQISEDHSFVETLVREGRLTPAQAEVHPQRNVLTRALGIEPDVVVDAWRVEVADGDRFLLCSDGLFNEVPDAVIEEVMARGESPDATADALVELALEAGARDNVSCVVADVADTGRSGFPGARGVERLAGAAAAVAPEAAPEPAAAAPDDPPAAERPPSVLTWRTVLVVLAVLATLAAAAGSVAWYARGTWWVKADGPDVALFRGPPEGILGIAPRRTVVSGLQVDDVVDGSLRDDVREGRNFWGDRDGAEAFIANLRRATATTTTPSTTTTSVPPS